MKHHKTSLKCSNLINIIRYWKRQNRGSFNLNLYMRLVEIKNQPYE